MQAWLARRLFRALHDLFLLPASKSAVWLTHSTQTGTEYLASVRTQIPSHVIPSLSDYEAEANEGSAEEDELDVSTSERAFQCRFIPPNSTRQQQSTMQTPQNL